MPACQKFQPATFTNNGQILNACQKCGRTWEAHQLVSIQIIFNDKLWEFESWAIANEKGFYKV
jgi:hypothetical protein